jgi:hypothetical protein
MRTVAIWVFGILASMIVGGMIGFKLDPSPQGGGSLVSGVLAGAFAFACLRLWITTPRS